MYPIWLQFVPCIDVVVLEFICNLLSIIQNYVSFIVLQGVACVWMAQHPKQNQHHIYTNSNTVPPKYLYIYILIVDFSSVRKFFAQKIDKEWEKAGIIHPAKCLIVEYFAPKFSLIAMNTYRTIHIMGILVIFADAHYQRTHTHFVCSPGALRAYVTSTANIQHHQFKRKIHFSDSIKCTSRFNDDDAVYLPWKVQIEKLSFSISLSPFFSFSLCICLSVFSTSSIRCRLYYRSLFQSHGLFDASCKIFRSRWHVHFTMSMPIDNNIFDRYKRIEFSFYFHHSIVCKCLRGSRFEK